MKISTRDNIMELSTSVLWIQIMGVVFTLIGVWIISGALILKLIGSEPSAPIWVGIIFILFGLAMTFFVKATKIVINKDFGTIQVIKKTLVMRKQDEYQFAELKEVLLRPFKTFPHGSGGSGTGFNVTLHANRYTYGTDIFIILNDQVQIDLQGGIRMAVAEPFYSKLFESTKITAEKIANFINLPLIIADGQPTIDYRGKVIEN